MKQLRWKPVNRKRFKDISYTNSSYVVGYDLDSSDMDCLVSKYNSNTITDAESNRLGIHVLTLLQIVMENPKFKSRPKEDYENLTDHMFMKMWTALKYIDTSKGRAYSYLYRSGYTAVSDFYIRKGKAEERQKEIDAYLADVWQTYDDECSDHKVDTRFREE